MILSENHEISLKSVKFRTSQTFGPGISMRIRGRFGPGFDRFWTPFMTRFMTRFMKIRPDYCPFLTQTGQNNTNGDTNGDKTLKLCHNKWVITAGFEKMCSLFAEK